MRSDLALYLHIPFCRRKCAYCDFVSYAGYEDWIPRYCDALSGELARATGHWAGHVVRSVFFGGGTPTLLAGEQMVALLETARQSFVFASDAEITLEGNPGTLREAELAVYRNTGVNRFSLGAQAVQPHLLEGLGRIHRWHDVADGFAALRRTGFENINLDLMFGLPGQHMEDWTDTLKAALALQPEHISCYALQVEDGTPLAARLKAGEGPSLPGEDEERELYASARRVLAGEGFIQYELSNFAKPGKECLQNLAYWTRREYMGFGCAAHSLIGNRRWSNTDSLTEYLAAMEDGGSPVAEEIRLKENEARFEALMLGLRLTEGVSSAEFKRRYGRTIEELWGDRLVPMCERGLTEWAGERLRLTERGMDLQNTVLVELMD